MATLNQFQQYSLSENTVTNNVLLMLSLLYEINPKYYEEYINALIDESELYQVIPVFIQQLNNKGNGFIDGHINIKPSTIIFETKLSGLEWIDKLLKYTQSFKENETKILFHLSCIEYSNEQIIEINKKLEQLPNSQDVKFYCLTYEKLVYQLDSLHNQYPFEPQVQRLASHFEAYCQKMDLLPLRNHILRAMACGHSFELNIKHQFYFDLASRGFSPFKYLGIYKNKAVRYIGIIENIVEADWNEHDGLNIIDSTNNITEEQKERLITAISDSVEKGWGIEENHRFFLLKDFHETYYAKTSPGGIFRVRYFNLEEELENVPNDVEEIALQLKSRTWK